MKNRATAIALTNSGQSLFYCIKKKRIRHLFLFIFFIGFLKTAIATPTITTQPAASQTACSGNSVTFSITATGTSLTYQWKKGGTAISGATSATYTKASLLTTDAGSYTCTVSDGTAVTSTACTLTVNATPAAPTVTTPVNYCQNATPAQLTATGTNLTWGAGGTTSGTAGGTAFLTATNYIDGQYGPSTNFTQFTTTTANVKIVSLDYTIPAYQAVTALVLSLYNNAGTLVATSSTNTTINNSTASAVKITNTFNYTIAAAGTYTIKASSGFGNIGGDNPSYPLTEGTGTINLIANTSGGYRCFNNIQFTVNSGATAPTPSTTTNGTTNYPVTQTVNGCVSPQAIIAVNVSAPPTTANAGPDQTGSATCGLTTVTLAGNAPTSGTGTWSIVSGASGTITTPTSATSTFTGTTGTAYTLRWTISNSCSTSTDDVNVTFNQSPTTANAGPDQTGTATCGSTTVTLAANAPSAGTGAWSIVTGTGGSVTTSTSATSTFNGTAGSTYTLRWTITNGVCTSADDVIITFNKNPTTANAGPDQTGATTCGLTTVTLAGNTPSIGTGVWSILSGTGGAITTASSATSTFTGTAGTTYTLRWTISNGSCTASTDDVIITFNQNPTTANAGPDQTGAATCGLTTVTLAGNSPATGTGAWSIVSGTGGTITTPSSATSTFTGTAGSTYTLRWTISNGPCTASTDDVIITFSQNTGSATISYAASAYCTSSGTAAVTVTGTAGGTFSSSTGLTINGTTGTITPATSTAGVYTVIYSMVSNGCTNTATTSVTITVAPSATISYTGTPYCSSAGTATVSRTGTAGGTFSAATGLVINATTGDITLGSSTAGTYTVTYTIAASGGCAVYTTTTSITITTQPWVTGNYAGNPYCTNFGIVYPSGGRGGAAGTITSAAGLTIDPNTGAANLGTSTPGNYTLTYTVPAGGGCAVYTATYNLVIIASPAATISYSSTPYCANAGTVPVTLNGTTGGTFSAATGLVINATSGDVNTLTSTAASYTVSYKIPAAGSCRAVTATAPMVITAPGLWTGAISTSWNNTGNWQCGIVPVSTTNVTIPTGASFYPILSGTAVAVNHLTLQTGATIKVNSGTLQIAGVATTTGGTINATAGAIEFNGTAAQTVPASLFTSNIVKDLIITNAAGVSLSGALKVSGTVGFGSVNNSVLASNGYLTLVSTSTNSANLNDVTNGGVNTGNRVTGNVTVERYIMGRRAYRFLTAPVTSTTSIKANWMENVNNTTPGVNINPSAGYGTQITGVGGDANGFDASTTNNASLYTFNIATQSWNPVTNTSGTFTAGNGFRIMVRGGRNVDLLDNYAVPSATTLRATGTVFTGPVTFTKAGGGGNAAIPPLTAVTNAFTYIANPYPSSVNWGSVVANNFTDISSTMYIFDPTISGSSNRGGYVAYNGRTNAKSVSSSLITNDLQSGQGIFIQTTGPNPSLTFQELYKSSTFLPVFRSEAVDPHISIELLLPEQVGGTGSADGTAVYFSQDYSNDIGDDDSYKFTNQDENLAILRNGVTLSLEGRKPVVGVDSIPLKIWQLTQKNYTLKIILDKFPDNVESYLVDKYLNTSTPFTNGTTQVPFAITSDETSYAADRFKVVFETIATLPVRITGLKAYEKNKGIQVSWVAESESNIDVYEVEKSANGQNFVTIGSAKPTNNPGVSAAYAVFDNNPIIGDNFYRIKTIEKSGEVRESEVVKVTIAGGKNTISIVSNPVRGKVIKLLFNNAEKGTYTASLIDASGRMVYTGNISYNGGTVYEQVDLNKQVPAGVYQLQLINGTVIKNIQVLVQ